MVQNPSETVNHSVDNRVDLDASIARLGSQKRARKPAAPDTSWPEGRIKPDLAMLPGLADPMDIFAGNSLTAEPELLATMLPPVIAAAAVDEAERINVTLQSVAMPMLSVCASVLHDDVVVQVQSRNRMWVESARLWCTNISDIAGKKTPSQLAAMRPLTGLAGELHQHHAMSLAKYKRDREGWDAAKKGTKRKIANSAESYSAPILDPAKEFDFPTEPVEPRQKQLVINEATIEALGEVLSANGRGALVQVDELPGLLAGFDCYRPNGTNGKDRALYLELYEGHQKTINRIGRGAVHVPHWGASLIANIQPDVLARLAPKLIDDGFLQRNILYFGRSFGRAVNREENAVALGAYRASVRRLYHVPPTRLQFDWDAWEWQERAGLLAEALLELPTTPRALKGHLGKWDALFARLAIVFHMLEGDGSSAIVGSTAERVFHFMRGFVLPMQLLAYGQFFGHLDDASHAQWIGDHILGHRLAKITARDIGRAYRAAREDTNVTTFAMDVLVKARWADKVGGGVHEHWAIRPRVHEMWAQRAQQVRERNEESARKIAGAEARVKEELS